MNRSRNQFSIFRVAKLVAKTLCHKTFVTNALLFFFLFPPRQIVEQCFPIEFLRSKKGEKRRNFSGKILWQNVLPHPFFRKKHRFFDVAKRFATKFATKISPVFLLFSNNVFQSNFCGQKKELKRRTFVAKVLWQNVLPQALPHPFD